MKFVSKNKDNSRFKLNLRFLDKCHGAWYHNLLRVTAVNNSYTGTYPHRSIYLSLVVFGWHILSLSLYLFKKTHAEMRSYRLKHIYANSVVTKFTLIKPNSIFSIRDNTKDVYFKVELAGKNCLKFPEKGNIELLDMNPEQVIIYHPKSKSIKV